MLITILIFLIVLSVIVFVHELGHFFFARRAGVKVEEFGFGFPPRMFGIKRGDTLYSVNAIPVGGFVRLKGESGEDADDKDSFSHQKIWRRVLIIIAGVTMNFLLAWALLTVGYALGVPQVIDESLALPAYIHLTGEQLNIVGVLDKSPAAAAGLKVGDVIITANNQPEISTKDFSALTSANLDKPLSLVIERAHEQQTISVTPTMLVASGKPGIGVGLMKTGTIAYPWYLAPVQGFWTTVVTAEQIVLALGKIVRDLVTHGGAPKDISGPVGIAVVTGEVARQGWRQLMQFTALLSVNLAVLNVLPLPALDGGRLIFLLIERIRGRALNRRLETAIHNIGFAFLLGLVVAVTYSDLLRFGGGIIQAFYKS